MNFVFVCLFLNKALIKKKKRTQNPESPQDKSVSLLDKMFTTRINSEWLAKKSFLLQKKCILSCQKKKKKLFTLLKYIIQNSFMCNMLNSK